MSPDHLLQSLQYLELLNFAEDGEPSSGMAKGARIEAKELPGAARHAKLPWWDATHRCYVAKALAGHQPVITR